MRCHDPHANGAYPVASSGIRPSFRAGVSGIPSGFPGFASLAQVFLSIRLRSVLAAAGPAVRRDPVSRVTCASACARAGAHIAAARFARLIARARQRAHVSRSLLRGLFAPARSDGRSGFRPPLPPDQHRYSSTSVNLVRRITSKHSNKQLLRNPQAANARSVRAGTEPSTEPRPSFGRRASSLPRIGVRGGGWGQG